MPIADFAPTSPSQGFSVLFNAAQLALAKVRGPQRLRLDSFEVDCTISESIILEADVTEFEVERGANINDHRRTKPVEFAIAGLVSDTPLDKTLTEEAVRLAAGPLGLAIDGLQAGSAIAAGDATISREAFDKLVRLYEFGTTSAAFDPTRPPTFSIVTRYVTLENMVVKSLRFDRQRGTGKALPFTAAFKEIRLVETATAQILSPAMLQAPKPLGEASPKQATETLKQSILKQIFSSPIKKTFPPPTIPNAPVR